MRLISLVRLSIAMIMFVCSSSIYGQAEKVNAIQNKKDSLKQTKVVGDPVATKAKGATKALVDDVHRGTIVGIGAIEDRDSYYFKDRRDSKEEIFYSNAPMYIDKHSEEGEASMLVLGTVKYDTEATVVQKGNTSLTGDFVSLKDSSDPNALKQLFIDEIVTAGVPEIVNTGSVNFIGKWNKQLIKREYADQKKNAAGWTDSGVPDDADKINPKMVLNFPTINVKKEGISEITDVQAIAAAPADADMVNPSVKPVYDFAYMGLVAAAPNVSMSVKELDITDGNRFSVEMITEGLYQNSQKTTEGAAGVSAASEFYKLNSAYVDIKTLKDEAPGKANGYSEVAMRLYNYSLNTNAEPINDVYDDAAGDVEVKRTNSYMVNVDIPSLGISNAPHRATFLRGITSPFENHMRADYMLYHLLTTPTSFGVTGDMGHPVGPPQTKIESGVGYLFAMDASREKFDNIAGNWHREVGNSNHDTPEQLREKGGYNFSRVLREIKYETDYYKASWRDKDRYDNYNFYTTLGDANAERYETQRFVTGPVTVEVYGSPREVRAGRGVNFLANPYMTPISIKEILGEKDIASGAIQSDRKVNPFPVGNTGAYAIHDLDETVWTSETNDAAILRARYWVINTGLVTTIERSNAENLYAYNIKYDVADYVNGAPTVPDVLDRSIEPMQVFVVQAAKTGTFTFTDDMKIFSEGNKGQTFKRFDVSLQAQVDALPKSTRGAESKALPLADWFVMEASVLDNEGKIDEISADRTSVRFFETASEGIDSDHDVAKPLFALQNSNKDNEEGAAPSPSNVLYTATPNADALLGNAVSYKVKEIPLHYLPGEETQDVSLYFEGLDGFERVDNVWLVDNFTGFEDKLYDGYEYVFKSEPNESHVGSKNRFTLVFNRDGESPSLKENPITCYYSGSILHIGGLNENDFGSKVYIYDLQGRLMGSTTINNYPSMEYQKTLGQGTFIVKIVGNRNFDTKFVNLQNY